MGALVSTDVTVTQVNTDRHIFGSERMNFATITFGGSAKTYPFGGIPMPTVARLGFNKAVDEIQVTSPEDGNIWRYDKTNHTLKAFVPAPPVVYEEVIDCDADTAYTKYPAAFIMYVASASTFHKVVSGLCTPATGQVAVDLFSATPGCRAKLTFPAGEGAATTYVTYATQAWRELFQNLVENESIDVTLNNWAESTVDTFDLLHMACAIQNLTWYDAGTIKAFKALKAGLTSLATKEASVDFVNTAVTTIGVYATDAINVTLLTGADKLYCTYIMKPTSGFLYNRFTDQEDLTPSSDIITLATNPVDNALLFGCMGDLEGTATTKEVELVANAATLGTTATIAKITAGMQLANTGVVVANTFTVGSNHSDSDHIYPSYIYGIPEEITPLSLLELPDGSLMSRAKTLRLQMWGK
jgi:hypothetical protein